MVTRRGDRKPLTRLDVFRAVAARQRGEPTVTLIETGERVEVDVLVADRRDELEAMARAGLGSARSLLGPNPRKSRNRRTP